MAILVLALAALPSLHTMVNQPVGPRASVPVVAPLDQESTFADVQGARPGSQIVVYANGFAVGHAVAQAGETLVPFVRPLQPEADVIAVERSYAGVRPSH